MLQNFNLENDSFNTISTNEFQENTFNNKTFRQLKIKRRMLESQFSSLLKDKNDLLSYYIFNPIKIIKNEHTLFRINKTELNNLFIESEEKRSHNEIYKTKLYNLTNPYYLVHEKKYIKPSVINERVKRNFNHEKESLKQRENTLDSKKYYDKENNIFFELLPKESKYNKIPNQKMLNEAVKLHCLIVTLKNNDDEFDKKLLLRPDFTIKELKQLISFLYKSCYNQNIIGTINLYYFNNLFNDISIEDDNKKIGELRKEMKNDLELEIFIQTQY